jgi:hypothetical protein
VAEVIRELVEATRGKAEERGSGRDNEV